MSKQDGLIEATKIAKEKLLNGVDIKERCAALGLLWKDGVISLRAFGNDIKIRASDFKMALADGQSVKISDQVLFLHYLLCDMPVKPTEELISYREFPGGQFYWEPFLSRTAKPLVKRFGNNLGDLEQNLNRFDWTPVQMGDLGARIQTVGKLCVVLIYRCGDEEFPPHADILFDSCAKRAYEAEDAAVMASRICIGLL